MSTTNMRAAWLAATCAAAMMGAPASAQTAAPPVPPDAPGNAPGDAPEREPGDEPGDEIVVTGRRFSDSLADALRFKRGADSIVDAVSAADIGKFPAVNIAEALQRIPGVSISREAGEGQFVSVRGLGPNFQSVTLNGSPIAYNENIRNSDQSGRQFQFRVIPADLVAAIVVAKSPTADLIDGGIGSNIDIRTARALDIAPFVTVRAFTHYEDRTGENTPNGSVSAAWRNADRTFGVVAGVSYQTRNVQFDRFQLFGYTNRTIEGQSVAVPSNIALTLEEEKRRRLSFLGGVQWEPVETLKISFDGLYSIFNNEIDENRILIDLGSRADFAARVVPGSTVVRDGVLYAADLRGGRINRNAEFSEQTHENLSLRLQAEFTPGAWRIVPSIGYSEAISGLDTPLQRLDGRTPDNPPGLTYGYDFGDNPVEDVSVARVRTNLDLTSPAAAPFFRYRIRPTNSEDKDLTAFLDVGRDIGARIAGVELASVRFGAQYTDRSRDYQRRDRELTLRPGVVLDANSVDRRLPRNVFDTTIDDRFGAWTTYNQRRFESAFTVGSEFDGTRPQARDLVANGADLQGSYGVDEKIGAVYGRVDLSADLGSVGVRGNVGLRWVRTETRMDGALLTAATGPAGRAVTVVTPQRFDGAYEEFLPSANLTVAIARNVFLRLAASRTLTRPSLADLRTATVPNSSLVADIFDRGQAAFDASVLSARNGVGGSPQLNPYTAVNLDASLEWYFPDFGGVSVALFHKGISDFIGAIARNEPVVFGTRTGNTIAGDLLITRP